MTASIQLLRRPFSSLASRAARASSLLYAPRGCYGRLADRRRAEQEAELRAHALFKECLTPTQWADYSTRGFFRVRGNATQRWYKITHGTVMNVEPVNDNGTFGPRMCFAPIGNLPTFDVLVAQKLALEGMEEEVLAVANQECRVRIGM